MYLGIVAACSILLLAPIARADCIIATTGGQEVDNGVRVLQTMTGIGNSDVKRINTSAPNQVAEIATVANGCSDKAYFVGHCGELTFANVKDAITNIASITEAAIYTCKCKGGDMFGAVKDGGKVKFCLNQVIWPAHIRTVIGFLVKPDQWSDAMKYQAGALDLAGAGEDLLKKMTLVHECQTVFKPAEAAAHKLYLSADQEYRQDRSKQNLDKMKSALADWQSKEAVYNDCNKFRAPERVPVLTRLGPLGPTTLTMVKYDGTFTSP